MGSTSTAEQWWGSEPWALEMLVYTWYKRLRLYELINLFVLLYWGKVLQRQKVWWMWLLMPGPCEDSCQLQVWALQANQRLGGGITVSKTLRPVFILSFKNCHLLLRNFPRVLNIDSTQKTPPQSQNPTPRAALLLRKKNTWSQIRCWCAKLHPHDHEAVSVKVSRRAVAALHMLSWHRCLWRTGYCLL